MLPCTDSSDIPPKHVAGLEIVLLCALCVCVCWLCKQNPHSQRTFPCFSSFQIKSNLQSATLFPYTPPLPPLPRRQRVYHYQLLCVFRCCQTLNSYTLLYNGTRSCVFVCVWSRPDEGYIHQRFNNVLNCEFFPIYR